MRPSLALLAPLALVACSHTDPIARFTEAKAAYAAEDYAAAREKVLSALSADADNRDMVLLLVHANLALGDGDGAQAALARLANDALPAIDRNELSAEAALLRGQTQEMEQALGTDQSPVAWRLRGEAALARGDGTTALHDFQQGMAAGFDFRLAWDTARMLIDGDDIDGAERAWAVMRQAGPDRLDTLLTAGLLAERRADMDKAKAAYSRASQRFAARPEPWLALADLADRMGDRKSAADYAAQAATRAPGDAQVVSMTVRIADEQGDWEKVRSLLGPHEATLDLHGPDAMAYARALHRLGRNEAARAMAQQMLSLSPQNPQIRRIVAQCDLDLGDAAAALRTIRPLADSVMAETSDLDLAIQAAERAHDGRLAAYTARRTSPQLDAIQAATAKALSAMAARDWAGAVALWRQVPGADADAQTLKLMALSASRLGQGDVAIGYADRALAADPVNPDMLYMAGVVRLNAARDLAAARSLLHKALERDPTNRLFRADYARAGG